MTLKIWEQLRSDKKGPTKILLSISEILKVILRYSILQNMFIACYFTKQTLRHNVYRIIVVKMSMKVQG